MVALHYCCFSVAQFILYLVDNSFLYVVIRKIKNGRIEEFLGHVGADVVFFREKKSVGSVYSVKIKIYFGINLFRADMNYVDHRRVVFENYGWTTGYTFCDDESFLHDDTPLQ
jgi:hypothetical protein